jgi:hypothetical protein
MKALQPNFFEARFLLYNGRSFNARQKRLSARNRLMQGFIQPPLWGRTVYPLKRILCNILTQISA